MWLKVDSFADFRFSDSKSCQHGDEGRRRVTPGTDRGAKNQDCQSGSFLLFRAELGGELPCGKCRGVGHVYAEEQEQCLAVAVAGGYPADSEVLLLVAEAALHDCGAQVADDSARGRDIRRLVLGFRSFADEVGRDAVFGAILPVFIAGIDCVRTDAGDLDACQRLLILNALLESCPFVEGFERMVLDERDAAGLYVVDLGSELDALVLLAAHNRTDIRTVDADDAVPHFLSVEVLPLLTVYFSDCQDAFVLFGGQSNRGGILSAQTVPPANELARQAQQPTLNFACG